MGRVVSSPWMRALIGLLLAVVGGAWTLAVVPLICADPGGCGLHMEYWSPTTWIAVLGGLAVTLLGVGLLLREIATPLFQP